MTTILIVDDEPENRRSLQRFLADNAPDWEIITAADEQSAVEAIQNHDPDVIVTDLVMTSDQGGMVVLRAAKEHDPLAMVLLITAYEKSLNRYQAFELGAFDCVQKNMPGVIAAEEILIKTRAAVRFREMMRERVKANEKLLYLGKFFDRRVLSLIAADPTLLELRNTVVTTCFWDIRGFSRLSETLKGNPELLSNFLTEYFQLATEVIFENDGVLDKFIGDGVMGLFGALQTQDDEGRSDAQKAVNAAVELQRRFTPLLESWLERWRLYSPQLIDIGLGCGIHTGDVMVGNLGSDIRKQFTAIGPHVNLAQRLESRAAKSEILISGTTAARVGTRFVTAEVEVLRDVKNISGEFPVFRVVVPG